MIQVPNRHDASPCDPPSHFASLYPACFITEGKDTSLQPRGETGLKCPKILSDDVCLKSAPRGVATSSQQVDSTCGRLYSDRWHSVSLVSKFTRTTATLLEWKSLSLNRRRVPREDGPAFHGNLLYISRFFSRVTQCNMLHPIKAASMLQNVRAGWGSLRFCDCENKVLAALLPSREPFRRWLATRPRRQGWTWADTVL